MGSWRSPLRALWPSPVFWSALAIDGAVLLPLIVWLNTLSAHRVSLHASAGPLALVTGGLWVGVAAIAVAGVALAIRPAAVWLWGSTVLAVAAMTVLQFFGVLGVGWIALMVSTVLIRLAPTTGLTAAVVVMGVASIPACLAMAEAGTVGVRAGWRRAVTRCRRQPLTWTGLAAIIDAAGAAGWAITARWWPAASPVRLWLTGVWLVAIVMAFTVAVAAVPYPDPADPSGGSPSRGFGSRVPPRGGAGAT